MSGIKRTPAGERFAAQLVKGGEDECWSWTGPTNQFGYPTLCRGGKGSGQMSARLLAYRLAFECEPSGKLVTTCGSATCLNPKHFALREEKPHLTLIKRFQAKIRLGADYECWPWTAHATNGYGFLSMGRKRGPVPAHRVAWEIANGPIPAGLLVRQKCGNRLCCNPAHLFLAVNTQDGPEASTKAVESWLLARS